MPTSTTPRRSTRLVSAFALKGLDAKGLVDELRARMRDELDYALEAANQTEFADVLRRPSVRPRPRRRARASTRRVLTTEWVDGADVGRVRRAGRRRPPRRRAGEIALALRPGLGAPPRRVQRRSRIPGNYRFGADGDVTFLDFGLVKRWTAGEWEQLAPCLDAIVVTATRSA